MELNRNCSDCNPDDGSNDCNDPDRISETQLGSKRAESRPASRSLSRQSRSQSQSQTNKFWTSTNPFMNFMSDFRKEHMQPGQKCTLICSLGGKQWRNMTPEEKQPFIDAANKNKNSKQPQSDRKQQQKQSKLDEQQSKSSTSKDTAPNMSGSSRKVNSPKKRKGSQQKHDVVSKKKRTKSDTDTNADTDTSGSIHTATTDCASDDSDTSP